MSAIENMSIGTVLTARQVDLHSLNKNQGQQQHQLGVGQITQAGEPRMGH